MKNKKIKITQVSRNYFPFFGGVESVVRQIVHSLPLDKFYAEIITCSNENKGYFDVIKNIHVRRCASLFEFKSNPISPEFIFRLSKVKTDVLHYHHPFIFSAIAHFIARPKYKKLIATYHSDVIKQKHIMKFFQPIYEKFLTKADKIHVLSPNIIENSSTLSKFKDKCVVIPYGIDLAKFEKRDEEKIQEIKERFPDKKILLFVGRLIYYKGIPCLIEAMKSVSKDAILVIIGEGELQAEFLAKTKEYNLEERVFFKGRATDQELINYYQACDAFIFPSIYQSEAFGIVQLEAMACGKPVVNTWLNTGVNYVSIDKETGLTVEPENVAQLAEAINILVSDNNLRNKLGQNAKKRAEDIFSLPKVEKKYIEFYTSVLD